MIAGRGGQSAVGTTEHRRGGARLGGKQDVSVGKIRMLSSTMLDASSLEGSGGGNGAERKGRAIGASRACLTTAANVRVPPSPGSHWTRAARADQVGREPDDITSEPLEGERTKCVCCASSGA